MVEASPQQRDQWLSTTNDRVPQDPTKLVCRGKFTNTNIQIQIFYNKHMCAEVSHKKPVWEGKSHKCSMGILIKMSSDFWDVECFKHPDKWKNQSCWRSERGGEATRKHHRPESSDSPVLTCVGTSLSLGDGGVHRGEPRHRHRTEVPIPPVVVDRQAGQTQPPCNGCGKLKKLVKAQKEGTQQA